MYFYIEIISNVCVFMIKSFPMYFYNKIIFIGILT